MPPKVPSVSGHVFLRDGRRGAVWYAKWRDAHGQHQKALGTVWPGKGPPPVGFLRPPRPSGDPPADVAAELAAILTDARRGALDEVRTGVTFADAAEDWLQHGERERDWKNSTVVDYRSAVRAHLLPAFGSMPVERVTTRAIESWRSRWLVEHRAPRQAGKLVSVLHAIFERAKRTYGLSDNPAAEVERLKVRYDASAYDFYSPEEVWALVRAAATERDGAIYLVAAFAGLRRGELLALRWRDVDFERRSLRVRGNYSHGRVVTPKSGKGRAVPMAPEVAQALARLSQRSDFNGPDDLVFPGEAGEHLDGSALRRRFKTAVGRAELRALRFHDLRHTFGSLAIDRASIVQVQAWMGHAAVSTTMRYLHHKSHVDEADLLGQAFRASSDGHRALSERDGSKSIREPVPLP
jgi:integrase